ncbi:hypothetical protein ACQEU3_40200 [Spirillospora sp. CA-253888]
MNRFQFTRDHRGAYGVKRLCRVLKLTRSSYYRWRATAAARAERVGAANPPAPFSVERHLRVPRITAELRGQGMRSNHKRVER